jgi:DNA-binding NtrC family response regulator
MRVLCDKSRDLPPDRHVCTSIESRDLVDRGSHGRSDVLPAVITAYKPRAASASLVGVEVLVLDADHRIHVSIERLLSEAHLHVTCVANTAKALQLDELQFFSVALIDLDTPAPGAGLETIRMLKQASPASMVIAMTRGRSYDDAVDAVRAGAIDLLLKAPASIAHLKDRVLDAAGRSLGRRKVDAVLADMRGVHEEFLHRFMESERRAIDLADKAAGRDPLCTVHPGDLRVLVVDQAYGLAGAMTAAKPKGFELVHATSGGEGLDRISSGTFHYAMIAEDVTDLPAMTLARAIRNQHPDTVVLTFLGPAAHGKVELVGTSGTRVLVKPFTDAHQLLARLDELAKAWRAKAHARRCTQAFRERHYDFLRRYVELRTKIQLAIDEGPG